jgi:hypothetical protein
MRKTIDEFVKEHSVEIDNAINVEVYKWDGHGGKGMIPKPAPTYSDEQRRHWIRYNQGLYNWAVSEGVWV